MGGGKLVQLDVEVEVAQFRLSGWDYQTNSAAATTSIYTSIFVFICRLEKGGCVFYPLEP